MRVWESVVLDTSVRRVRGADLIHLIVLEREVICLIVRGLLSNGMVEVGLLCIRRDPRT